MNHVELPRYVCHKTVWAAKITAMDIPALDWRSDGGANEVGIKLSFGEIGGHQDMPLAWYAKHAPEIGGYYVMYEDGYQSYSPAQVFEAGYTKE